MTISRSVGSGGLHRLVGSAEMPPTMIVKMSEKFIFILVLILNVFFSCKVYKLGILYPTTEGWLLREHIKQHVYRNSTFLLALATFLYANHAHVNRYRYEKTMLE